MKSKRFSIFILIIIVVQLACNFPNQSPTDVTTEQLAPATNTPLPINSLPTQTPLPTYTDVPTQTPLPTYTQVPSRTSLPTNTPQPALTLPAPQQNGALWFEDDCTNIDVGRALFGLEYMNFSVSNGQCHVTANSNGNILPVLYAYPPLDNIAIELDLSIDGENSKSEYGIVFQGDEEFSDGLSYYYLLSIQPTEKLLAINLWHNNQWVNISKQEISQKPLIPGKQTHVRLEIVNHQFRVFLDGSFTFEAFDNKIAVPGIFGVAVGSYSAPETLHYDNLKVYALAP